MQQWRVRDVMTRRVVTATIDTPVAQVARLLAVHRVSALPIVDDDRRVLGVVSEADLPGNAEAGSGRTGRRRRADATAGAVMTSRPVTVPADAPLSVAAMKMRHSNAGRLLVTDADGRLLGVVARSDVLRPLTRPDTAVRDDVVENVLRRALWIDPGQVRVDVHDGVVTLAGTVGRRTTAAIAVRLVGQLPGVTEVVDRLRFEVDDIATPRPGTGRGAEAA